ncbi:MAG: DUF1993 family protein [Proteobacteria bacterium]|nr:DUF1993 family protein [Pseudomonadota bacterium]MDA0928660.1 DUF1993 family protein [Pseudomonadota bacterium]
MIALNASERESGFRGLSYPQSLVLPNIMFHATAVFNILRHNGVAIGKLDRLGAE